MENDLFGELELNRMYQMDCLEGIKLIPDKSVKLIVIDPPYNIGKDKRWDKWETVDAYISFMKEVFRECERILMPNGSFYWFHNDMKQIRKLMDVMDETSFVFKQLITWNKIDPSFKNHGYVQQRLSIDMMRNYYNGFTEYCVYYTFQNETGLDYIDGEFTGSRNPFRKELIRARKEVGMSITEVAGRGGFHGKVNHGGAVTNWEKGYNIPLKEQWDILKTYLPLSREYDDLRKEYEFNRYPFNVATVKDDLRANSNVWLYPPAKKMGHITPKPVEMIENIILHSSNEGDTVLDCFMGSGTTAVAALNTNRNYIGFERESEYIEIANKRLDELVMTLYKE